MDWTCLAEHAMRCIKACNRYTLHVVSAITSQDIWSSEGSCWPTWDPPSPHSGSSETAYVKDITNGSGGSNAYGAFGLCDRQAAGQGIINTCRPLSCCLQSLLCLLL
jgi:hypothetical protein